MSKRREKDFRVKMGLATGLASFLAVLVAPGLVVGAAVSGYLGYKASEKIAHKKYSSRDVGGAFPSAILILATTATTSVIGGAAGHSLVESFKDNASNQHSSIMQMQDAQIASSPVQSMLDTPITHNGKTVQLTLKTA
tara:strand:- start:357449 stop:357862 length:414 start_codon:yes stop_codon:yes gene_type:complete